MQQQHPNFSVGDADGDDFGRPVDGKADVDKRQAWWLTASANRSTVVASLSPRASNQGLKISG